MLFASTTTDGGRVIAILEIRIGLTILMIIVINVILMTIMSIIW